MTNLDQRDRERLALLEAFYDETHGAAGEVVDMWAVAEKLGIDRRSTNAAFNYLLGERLVETVALGGRATITHQGVKTVESARRDPQRSAGPFPPLATMRAPERATAFRETPWAFIASLPTEMIELRDAARDACLRARFLPIGMETWSTDGAPSSDEIVDQVAACDLIILVVATRYGQTAPGRDQSYAELEYAEALRLGKPVLAFVARAQAKDVPLSLAEQDDAQAFRTRLGENLRAEFETTEQLKTLVYQSLVELKNRGVATVPATAAEPTSVRVGVPKHAVYYEELHQIVLTISFENGGTSPDSVTGVQLTLDDTTALKATHDAPLNITPRPLDVEGLRLEPGTLIKGAVFFDVPGARGQFLHGFDTKIAAVKVVFVRGAPAVATVNVVRAAALSPDGADIDTMKRLTGAITDPEVRVTIGLEAPHSSASMEAARRMSRERADRIKRGHRVARVMRRTEWGDYEAVFEAGVSSQQAAELLVAGASWEGALEFLPEAAQSAPRRRFTFPKGYPLQSITLRKLDVSDVRYALAGMDAPGLTEAVRQLADDDNWSAHLMFVRDIARLAIAEVDGNPVAAPYFPRDTYLRLTVKTLELIRAGFEAMHQPKEFQALVRRATSG